MHSLFPIEPPKSVSKAQFATMVNLSKGRISQLVEQGLPVDQHGRVIIAEARCWMEDNLNPRRRKHSGGQGSASVKDRREQVELEKAEIELQRLKGDLIDRRTVERTIYGLSRAERDAWQTWPLRIAAEMAGELGVDEGLLLAVLRNKVRDELERLAGPQEIATGEPTDE